MHETLLYLILAEWIIMHQTIGLYAYNKNGDANQQQK